MDSSAVSVVPSLTLARRRRQARLRQTLHEVDIDESPDSPEKWVSFSDSNRGMCHNGFELVSKRREANARERLRVKNLNSGFAKLRRILPTVPPNRKPSKVDTLQGAIDYIYQLERVLEATGGIPNIKKTLGASGHSHSRQSVTERPFIDDTVIEDTHAAMIRYAPPFNRYENTTNIYPRCAESRSPPARFSYLSENYAGMSYLTLPQPFTDGRIPYCNNSTGYPSPTSSINSDDSFHCSRAYLNDRVTNPNSPPSRYSPNISSVPIGIDKNHSQIKPLDWTTAGRSNEKCDFTSRNALGATPNYGSVRAQARNVNEGDNNASSSRCLPVSIGCHSSLPPLSILYGAT